MGKLGYIQIALFNFYSIDWAKFVDKDKDRDRSRDKNSYDKMEIDKPKYKKRWTYITNDGLKLLCGDLAIQGNRKANYSK